MTWAVACMMYSFGTKLLHPHAPLNRIDTHWSRWYVLVDRHAQRMTLSIPGLNRLVRWSNVLRDNGK